eukprot:gene11709-14308_t
MPYTGPPGLGQALSRKEGHMIFEDEPRPRPRTAFQPALLEGWAEDDLRAYIGELQGEIARAEAAAQLPPVPLPEVLTAADPEFRKALVVCRGLPTAAYVELQSIHDGEPG